MVPYYDLYLGSAFEYEIFYLIESILGYRMLRNRIREQIHLVYLDVFWSQIRPPWGAKDGQGIGKCLSSVIARITLTYFPIHDSWLSILAEA